MVDLQLDPRPVDVAVIIHAELSMAMLLFAVHPRILIAFRLHAIPSSGVKASFGLALDTRSLNEAAHHGPAHKVIMRCVHWILPCVLSLCISWSALRL